jgi:hypothetical protein
MREREPNKEAISRGDLYFLWHPGTENVFSGYGLAVKAGSSEHLVGLLMIDRPPQGVAEWLQTVEEAFGQCELVAMTAVGERGILCQMQIDPESQPYLKRFPFDKAAAIESSLQQVLEERPNAAFIMSWDEKSHAWRSQIASPDELSPEFREVFEWTGYGCLAVEANIGVVHVCHASDTDIEGFADKPVWSQWQLILMPTAPLIRLELVIPDRPDNPFKFESFLNVAEEDQARVLAQLANQDQIFMAFYGDDLGYRYAKVIPHDEQQWQQLDELMIKAIDYWERIPAEQRDYDRAKAEFINNFI